LLGAFWGSEAAQRRRRKNPVSARDSAGSHEDHSTVPGSV
jgi:hypothetical protein